ncbi:D-lactate dehydrogenase [Blastomyces parvus]|uniref:D-lactate dehydrogenase n=1 Tax=Blastomyces parvus TaxID=2060905 RepID=A0A2B7WRC1_9EURO|nr:D-lactate dehydrogenase [Blastomyces parvus]
MKVAVFSFQEYERTALERFNEKFQYELVYFSEPLSAGTVSLAAGCTAVSTFVSDYVDAEVLRALADAGTKLVALRCAGHDSVDLQAASENDIIVMRVPAYSPYAIAEYTIGMLLTLDRNIHKASTRVRTGNFDLNGLVGNNIYGKTVGILGTGRIGAAVARTFKLGFGCHVIANDLNAHIELEKIGVDYVDQDTLFRSSDFICLHCPLTKQTSHIINTESLQLMKPEVLLVNTSRGGLIDTPALIDSLENGRIRGCALDVYEGENDLLFRKSSMEEIDDPILKRLVSLPNVILTGHQAFLTQEAIDAIAETTLKNIQNFLAGKVDVNRAVEKYNDAVVFPAFNAYVWSSSVLQLDGKRRLRVEARRSRVRWNARQQLRSP